MTMQGIFWISNAMKRTREYVMHYELRPLSCLAAALIAFALIGCSETGDPPPTATTAGPAYPAAGWPVIHHDSRNSDTMKTRGPDHVTPSFHVLAGTPIGAGATVGPEGNVYVGVGLGRDAPEEGSCHLFALDGETGEMLWCSDRVNDRAVASSPAIDRDGHIYIGDNRAMNSFTREGSLRWRRPIVGFPVSSQFTPDGHLIFTTHIGRVYVLRRDTGEPVLEPLVLLPSVSYTPSAFDYIDCFVGSSESACYSANTLSIDQDTGAFYFTLTRPGEPESLLVAMRYLAGPDPAIEPLWENAALEGGTASSPCISADGGRLYVNDQADHLLALDATTGGIIWTFDLGFSSLGSPSCSSTGLIFPSGAFGAPLVAVQDAGDHAELVWSRVDVETRGITVQRGGDRAYAAVVDAGRIFGLRLLVIDSRTGITLDEEPISLISSSTVGTTMSEEGHVYVPGLLGGLWGFSPG